MSRTRGMFANLPTAFRDGGDRLDLDRMSEHVAWLTDKGIHGFSTQLSAGEFAYQTIEERKQLTKAIVDAAGGERPVLAGISANSTREVIELAENAETCGVAAAMLMPRSYITLRRAEVIELYRTVGSATNVPIGIYNNPVTTGVDIDADIYAEIVELGGISITKDGSGVMIRVSEVMGRLPPEFTYLWGTESLVFPALCMGAHGTCCAINSVLPDQMLEIYRLTAEENDWIAGRKAYEAMLPIFSAFQRVGVARSAKAVAALTGRSLGPHRKPLQNLGSVEMGLIQSALEHAGILEAN